VQDRSSLNIPHHRRAILVACDKKQTVFPAAASTPPTVTATTPATGTAPAAKTIATATDICATTIACQPLRGQAWRCESSDGVGNPKELETHAHARLRRRLPRALEGGHHCAIAEIEQRDLINVLRWQCHQIRWCCRHFAVGPKATTSVGLARASCGWWRRNGKAAKSNPTRSC
jgi:hypothetical protein